MVTRVFLYLVMCYCPGLTKLHYRADSVDHLPRPVEKIQCCCEQCELNTESVCHIPSFSGATPVINGDNVKREGGERAK